jgi:hypothetical protein
MTSRKQSAELADEDAAVLAAEIARLDMLFGAELWNQDSKSPSRLNLREEIHKGPLRALLDGADPTGKLALLRAKSQLAAHDASVARRPPPWPRRLGIVLTAVVLPLILLIAGHFFASYQQLELFREEARRRQADALLGQLSSLVIEATHLKDQVIRDETYEFTPLQAGLLREKVIEFEQKYNASVQLHISDDYPDLKKADERAASEIRALQDCLQAAAMRPVNDEWRRKWKLSPEVNAIATSASPCGRNFSVEALSGFMNTVNQTIDVQIGGALFPRKSQK